MSSKPDGPFQAAVYSISAISLLSNSVLLYVYIWCPLNRIKSYKYFFLLTILQDVIYSVTFALNIPQVISQHSILLLLGTGIVNERSVSFTLILLYGMVFFVSTLSVTNSFIYRYLHLCRNEFVQRVSSKQFILIGCLLNMIILGNVFYVLHVAILPGERFVDFVTKTVIVDGIDMSRAAFFGFSMKYCMESFRLALIIELILLLSLIALVNVFCALKIKSYLKNAKQTSNFLSLQRQMFLLLLLQAACPIVFLVTPYCFAVFLLFTGIDSNKIITDVLSILLAVYPIFNPIIIITFMKEYRNFIAIKLKLSNSHGQSNMPFFLRNFKIASVHLI
ncbi:hypothetical protein V3C99_010024 [Haemonchus contortus]